MKNILVISNIPSPYRVKLNRFLQQKYKEFSFTFLYTNCIESDRLWSIREQENNRIILKSKILKFKGNSNGGTATRYIHIPNDLLKTIKKINPDIIIASEYNISAFLALCWCKLNDRKYINLTDGTLHSESKINVIQKFNRYFIIKNSNAYIASSTKASEKLKKWGAKDSKIFISLLTVDVSPFLTANREPINNRLLYVGRISKEKGLDILIDALQYVKNDFELHIVGNDVNGEKIELIHQIEEYHLSEKIKFVGFKENNDLLDEYSKAKCLIVPSRSDCFGLVMVEALAMGLPIIASKYADGFFDIIKKEDIGEVVDPFDAKMFAKTIDKFIDKKIHTTRNYSLVNKFLFDSTSTGYYNAISEVIEG